MASIRARASAAYAAALVGSLALFAATVWLARGASGDRELQRYVNEEAEVTERLLAQASGPGLALTEVQDSLIGPLAVPRVQLLLDALPEPRARHRHDGAHRLLLARGAGARGRRPGAVAGTAARLSPTLAGKRDVTREPPAPPAPTCAPAGFRRPRRCSSCGATCAPAWARSGA